MKFGEKKIGENSEDKDTQYCLLISPTILWKHRPGQLDKRKDCGMITGDGKGYSTFVNS